ncbi:MAG: hypothetical protein ACR2OI_00960 [Acidimicrobiia bacterium]
MAFQGLCDPAALNQAFIESEPFVHEQIADPTMKLNMPYWANMIPKAEYEMGQGYTKSKWQFHAAPAPQDDAMSLWHPMQKSAGDDPGPTFEACNPPVHTVSYGFEQKSYSPYELVLQTTDICLTDISFDWQFEQQVSKIVGSWLQITSMVWENWNRDNYHSHCTIMAASADLSNVGATVGALPSPATVGSIGRLTQGFLDLLYERLFYQAGMYAMGNMGGSPMFGLNTSRRESKQLLRDDSATREDVRYWKPELLLNGYGDMPTYSQWVHMHDPFPPRYRLDGAGAWERVWPHSSAATTIGSKWDINVDYLNAPYQISSAIMQGVFTNRILPVVQRFGGDVVRTMPADYMGSFRWNNIPDPECNPDGEIGRWRAKFRAAPEPGDHDFAVGILHRRCDIQDVYQLCSEDESAGGGDPIQSYVGVISAITDPASGAQITHDYTLASALPATAAAGDTISVLRADLTTVILGTLTTITDTTHVVVTFAGAEDIDANAPAKLVWDSFDQA